jgi:hypothetical protein
MFPAKETCWCQSACEQQINTASQLETVAPDMRGPAWSDGTCIDVKSTLSDTGVTSASYDSVRQDSAPMPFRDGVVQDMRGTTITIFVREHPLASTHAPAATAPPRSVFA